MERRVSVNFLEAPPPGHPGWPEDWTRIEEAGVTDAGLFYAIWANPLGFRAGYVYIPEEHPWSGIHYRDLQSLVTVHGGVTFSDWGLGDEKGTYWLLGFDCGHAYDLPDPSLVDPEAVKMHRNIVTYRDIWNQLEQVLSLIGARAGPDAQKELKNKFGVTAVNPDDVPSPTLKPLSFVREECQHLARQIAAARDTPGPSSSAGCS